MVADPELKYTPSGVAVTRFRIAVNRPFTNQQGEREADFIDIVAWRQSAQFAADYLHKGRLVGIEGRLQVRSYTTADGQRRKVSEVVADNVRGLDRAKENEPGAGAPAGNETGGEESPEGYDPFEGQ
jgi:single-strand DNA-binding protein